jgi:hypothetical protein
LSLDQDRAIEIEPNGVVDEIGGVLMSALIRGRQLESAGSPGLK